VLKPKVEETSRHKLEDILLVLGHKKFEDILLFLWHTKIEPK
jgi:hypothetical protein